MFQRLSHPVRGIELTGLEDFAAGIDEHIARQCRHQFTGALNRCDPFTLGGQKRHLGFSRRLFGVRRYTEPHIVEPAFLRQSPGNGIAGHQGQFNPVKTVFIGNALRAAPNNRHIIEPVTVGQRLRQKSKPTSKF